MLPACLAVGERSMRVFLVLALLASSALAAYGAWVVADGFLGRRICVNGYCATFGVLHQGFIPLAVLHGTAALVAFWAARACLRRLRGPAAGD